MSTNRQAPKPKPRGKKKRFEYLRHHFRYHTLNPCNQSTAPARCVKLSHLDMPKEVEETAWEILDVDQSWEISGFSQPLEQWQIDWNDKYQWGANGRSGGYVVMYHGERKPSGYRSHCLHCGQLDYAKVMERAADDDLEGRLRDYMLGHNSWRPEVYPKQSEVQALGLPEADVLRIVGEVRQEWEAKEPRITFHDKCGQCGRETRVNFTKPHMQNICWPGKPVFAELLDGEYEEVRDQLDLDHVFEVVYSFDVAVDQAIANFIDYCRTHKIVDETYTVEKTRRVPIGIADDNDQILTATGDEQDLEGV